MTRAPQARAARTRRVGAWLTLGAALGCGEVYADIDVVTETVTDPVLTPSAVFAGAVTWIEVHARFDGSSASVESHGFDGSDGVKLAYDRLGFFAGPCPDSAVSETAVSAAAATALKDESGAWVFCAAIEVGPFDETASLSVPFVFWSGSERVTGTAGLTVNVTTGSTR